VKLSLTYLSGMFAVGLALAGCASLPNQATTERYIIESEHAWAESVASGDPAAVERILADGFLGVDTDGRQYTKSEMVANTRDGPKYFVANHANAIRVRFFDKAAVAQGDESWVKRSGERGRFVWTDTWVLRNGTWQIVAAEDLIAPDPAPAR
jgi:hypothetical protein